MAWPYPEGAITIPSHEMTGWHPAHRWPGVGRVKHQEASKAFSVESLKPTRSGSWAYDSKTHELKCLLGFHRDWVVLDLCWSLQNRVDQFGEPCACLGSLINSLALHSWVLDIGCHDERISSAVAVGHQ